MFVIIGFSLLPVERFLIAFCGFVWLPMEILFERGFANESLLK